MNIPGEAEGNWRWRFRADQLTAQIKERLADLTAVYSRWNGTPPAKLDPHHLDRGGRRVETLGRREGGNPAGRDRDRSEPSREDGPARGKSAKPRKKRQGEVKTAGGKKNPAG